MNLIIRPYEEKDLEKVVPLMKDLQDFFAYIDIIKEVKTFSTNEEAKAYLQETFKKVEELEGVTYIAEVDQNIAGFVQGIVDSHTGDIMHKLSHHSHLEGWIGFLFTKPEFRNMGVGHALMDKMKDYFVTKKCSIVKLYVASENEAAIKIYEGYGFKATNLEMTLTL